MNPLWVQVVLDETSRDLHILAWHQATLLSRYAHASTTMLFSVP